MNNNNINNIILKKLNTNENNPIKIYTIYKKNEKKIKYKYGNFESIFNVEKYYSKSKNDNIEININGEINSGASAIVFLDIGIKNKIFKEIKDKNNDKKEFKALLFQYFIQKYYKYSDEDKLKYLCMLDEFGNIIVDIDYIQFINKSLKLNYPLSNKNIQSIGERYYAIMENCGTDLSKYFSTLNKNKNNLQKLLNIFKECCQAVKIIHDLGYLHLDIKPQNFLISNKGQNKEQIKIIDFGESQKVGYPTNDLFGTSDYIANDWMKNYLSKEETILQYHHDIFALGCMFVELLFKYILKKKDFDMVCPLKELSNKKNISIIQEYRENYNIKQHNKMLKVMKDANIKGNIITLIDRMVNPDPKKRYQKIDDVITQIDSIIKELKK